MEPGSADSGDRFSLVLGGPFHGSLRRLRLTGADHLPTQRAALLLALVAWLLPALLVVAQSLADDRYSGWGFFTDWTVHTRYLIAIWTMIATERYADGRLISLVHHFRAARILSDADRPAFKAALAAADRRSASRLAELVILAAALIWSSLTAYYAVILEGAGWDGAVIAGESALSWAGEVARFISTPLFLFLVLRWIWRFLVWTALLYRISRLPLQLMPLHPDRSGGLGFLAIFPSIFGGFLFALSCVVAAAMVKELDLEQHTSQTVWFALAGWLVISVGLVLGPLLVFVKPLFGLRERALIEYGRLASQHHLAFHHKWVAGNRDGEELLGSDEPSSVSDLNVSVEMVQKIRLFPADRPVLFQILIAAALPMLAVVVTQLPFLELIKWLASAIL